MNPPASQPPRRLVPRWRSLAVTLQSHELGQPVKKSGKDISAGDTSADLLTRLERWRLSPSLITAAELVEACIVEGREREAIDAARRLVAIDRNAAPLIHQQAAQLLIRTGHEHDLPSELLPGGEVLISERQFTRLHPRDPLAWVELALHQTIRGSPSAAEKTMRVALNLAPNNRHVLRSAARLFLHQDDPERALATVVKSAATRSDPWLIASEIALANVARRQSRLLKAGTIMLASAGLHPRQITELAGAIATEELGHGNRKKSRKCFTQSMIDPTGSALAQGEWASPALGGDLVTEARIASTFENAEASAFHLYRFRRFEEVSEACQRWAQNDPFSIRPLEFGATVAGHIEEFETALKFANRGLLLRPSSPVLLNALAYAAASLNKLEDAEEAIRKLRLTDSDKTQRSLSTANLGLIAFRRGDQLRGRAFYNQAIKEFTHEGSFELAARARIYLAREAMLATASDWQFLLKEAQEAMSKFKGSEGVSSLNIVEKAAATIVRQTESQKLNAISPAEDRTQSRVKVRVKFTQLSFNLNADPSGKGHKR